MRKSDQLTFAAFQATRRWCDDLRPFDVICADTDTRPPRGWLYLSSNYITQVEEWWPNNVRDEGQWHLQLSRDETVSDNLVALERELFQWALMEGYNQDDARNALIAEYGAWNADNGLKLGSADEHTMDDSITEPQRAWLRDFCARWEAMEHGEDESEPAPSDRQEAAAICAKWVKRIGGGFHPDTRGGQYVWTLPGVRGWVQSLTVEQVAEYEADMERLFALDLDPYAVAVEALLAEYPLEGAR